MLRFTYAGKENTLSLGPLRNVSLAEARVKAAEAKALIAYGIDPITERRKRRAKNIESNHATFKAVGTEWLNRHRPNWSSHHYERNEGLLRRLIFPDLGDMPISEITEPMLLGVLKRAYDNGIKESARRARAVAQQVFDYAKDTFRATSNPARELSRSTVLKKPTVRHFAALKATEVGAFLNKLDTSGVQPTTQLALMLMLYTGLRDASLRGARWNEINLNTGEWTIPADRMKTKRPHRVPLPTQAVALLRSLKEVREPKGDDFIFASRGKSGHLAENTLRIAMHRLGFEVTVHGFRSLITDVLNECEFNPDAIERQLAHVEKNKVRRAYLRTDFYPYRAQMMQWFADWADAQRRNETAPAMPSNVLAFHRAA
jgi:integrase